MRYPPEHKVDTHERIVSKAAQEFRRCGLDGIGIANLMKELGLTHGGFYSHFDSKDDLIAEASVAIVRERMERLVATAEAQSPGRRAKALIDIYLSREHRDNADKGCILPALAADLARRPPPVREPYTKALSALFDRIAAMMPAKTASVRRSQALALFSALAGTILVARSVSDLAFSDRVLEASRLVLSEVFSK